MVTHYTDAQAHKDTEVHYRYTARLCVSSITPKQRRLIMLPAGEWQALHRGAEGIE